MIKLVHLLYEGKYDTLTTSLTRELMNIIKNKERKGKIEFLFPGNIPIAMVPGLEFVPEITLEYNIKYVKKLTIPFDIDGEGDDESIVLNITINTQELPQIYSDLVPVLKDAIRHELEHVAQNLLNRPESEKFEVIPPDNFFKYLTAKHEVPAFVRGLYKQAKTRKIPLSTQFEYFFEDYSHKLTNNEINIVRNIWTNYAQKHLPAAKFV
jgi:hypothetical protein